MVILYAGRSEERTKRPSRSALLPDELADIARGHLNTERRLLSLGLSSHHDRVRLID